MSAIRTDDRRRSAEDLIYYGRSCAVGREDRNENGNAKKQTECNQKHGLSTYLANVRNATAISLTAVSGYPLDLSNGFTLSRNLLVNIPLLTSCADNDATAFRL